MSNFFEELKKRNVYKVATAYAISSWLIIQVVNTIGPNLDWPDSVPSLITKVLLVGFPIALVLTWLYEFTPHGLRRTGSFQQDTYDNRKAGRRLNRLIIAVLAVTVCFMLVERVFFAEKVSVIEIKKASIAVLPFDNFSPDDKDEYFADGLTEQIIDELAQISGLEVTARTSSFSFKDQDKDIKEIATALGVNYVLEGSVRYDEDGNRIRITVQLINANNGYHLWSKTYDEDFTNIFRIQDNIGREVSSQLRIQVLPEELFALSSNMTDNTEAYKLYVKARQKAVGKDQDIEESIDLLKEAIILDPEFSEAFAELSVLYLRTELSKKERDKLAEHYIEKAIEIAPENPEVLKAKASWKLRLGQAKDSSEVIKDLRRVISLKPNDAAAHYLLSSALNWGKQPVLAIKSLDKAASLNPINVDFINLVRARAYLWNHNEKSKAIEILDEIIANDSSNNRAILTKSLIVSMAPFGDLTEAFKMRHMIFKGDSLDRWNLNFGILGPLDLDLWPYSEKLGEILKYKYPDSKAIWNDYGAIQLFKRDMEAYKKIVDYAVEKEWLTDEEIIDERVHIQLMSGNSSKALKIFEEGFPDFKNEEVLTEDISWENELSILNYSDLLKINGQKEKADRFSKKLCDYYKNKMASETNISENQKDNMNIDCLYVSDQKEEFIQVMEKIFFVKKSRYRWYANMRQGYYLRFEDDADYQRLFKKIETETHRMRDEVITYLKEQGDWNPAWDNELGLE